MICFPRPLLSSLAITGALLTFLGCGGGGDTPAPTPTPTPAPTISSFLPTSGAVGQSVVITGTTFTGATTVKFHGTAATAFTVNSATQITATVPNAATTGTVAVTTPAGTGTSAGSFTVTVPATVTSMDPTRGPEGTPVVFGGTGFTSGASVTFGGVAAASVTVQSPNQLTALVPTGASTGPVVVTVDGTGHSAGSFTVAAASTTQDLSIDGLYLVQSVQDYAGSVPLVANRDAYLRVFVKANQASVPPPVVRVTVTNGGTPWTQDIAAPGGMTQAPTSIDESQWGASWNLLVPAAQLLPGATLLAQVNPASAIPEVDGTNNTFPRSGTAAALNVQTVKTFKTTLVPITQQGLTGNVTTGRTAASWVDRLKRMYPIQAVDVQVRSSALSTTANLNTATGTSPNGAGWSTALSELETARLAEASDRYYFGSVNVSYDGGTAGLGYVPSSGSSTYRSALGWDKYVSYAQDGYNYPEVLAHEVGHNFGRSHAPCGVSDPDPSYPTDAAHAEAAIGVYGYDVANSALKLPTAKDIMSYCDGNLWVSDYTYKGVLAYRAAGPIGDVQVLGGTAPFAVQPCLIVTGTIENGVVSLNPSFQVDTIPSGSGAGSHELRIEDASGRLLRSAAFEPAPIADFPGGKDVRHFAMAVPVDADTQAAMQSLRVVRGGQVVAERQRASALREARLVRDPVARRMRLGQAHLSWDSAAHPKVMVRDPRTGEVIAFLEGGSALMETDSRELEYTFSDGVRSERRVLRAQD